MNETKGEEETETDNDRETYKPPDVSIPAEKDCTEAGEGKLKAESSTNKTLNTIPQKNTNN